MENRPLHDDKLFRAVNDRLSDYEAPYNGADWDAMSRSLDQLPKASRFQWKISLNTLLIALGVAGISVLGYAFASHTGKNPPAEAMTQPAVSTEAQPKMQNTAMTTNALSQHEITTAENSASTPVSSSAQEPSQSMITDNAFANEHASGQNQKSRKKNPQATNLFFGDQIDLRKGFIHQTHEDPAVTSKFKGDAIPDTYYDLDKDGKVIPIKIDSSKLKDKVKGGPVPLDSTASVKPAAPTGDNQRTGFDNL